MQAALVRVLVFVAPIAGSIVFVHFASCVVAVPTGSFALFISWWVLMSAAATLVLIAIERSTRRLLPLATLYKLSLVFPDAAPSRFRMALKTGTTASLQERIAASAAHGDSTSVGAAQRLLALARELDGHDSLTRGHSERVRAYAQMIGRELHLGSDELDLLNWAALLHDVGKLGVPAPILTKPGRPTDEEWQVLRGHPEIGESLVVPLRDWLSDWADAVGQHHERWDGQGYPRGLAGEEISLAARIVAVADTFDVITSVRSYKSGFASTAAREEIAACAGAQFDPRVVRAFLNISLGRLRLVMGPLSWLSHAPILGRFPLTPAIGTIAGTLATVAVAVSAGAIATPPEPALASVTQATRRATITADLIRKQIRANETTTVVIGDRLRPSGNPLTLTLTSKPSTGRAAILDKGRISYTPPRGYTGVVEIGYLACGPTRCIRGSVLITVLPASAVTVTTAVGRPRSPKPATAPSPAAPPAAPPADPANHPPAAVDDPVSVPEGGTVTLNVLANDSDPDGDQLTLESVGDPALGRASIVGGDVRFEAPSDYGGNVTVPYAVTDKSTTVSAEMVVDVQPLNDAPTFANGPNQAVLEDSGGQIVPGWATNIRPGPPGESAQRVDFLVANSNPGLFSADGQPALSERGTLSYTPAPDAAGSATVTVQARDDGGNTLGGIDSSPPRTLTITVTPVNDAPSFAGGADQTAVEDAGGQIVSGWATNIRPGPPGESAQRVDFLVANSNPGLFSADGQPALSERGTLSYTPAPDAAGSATVTVQARDDGGNTLGGIDSSPPRTLTITVTPVNDAPIARPDNVTVAEDDVTGVVFDVLANDSDLDGDTTLSLSSYDGSTIASGALGDNGAGRFTYLPDPGFFGTDSFTYVVSDGNGGTATATVTITVTSIPHAPLAADDAYTTDQDTALSMAAPGLLANDGDQDGDQLTVDGTPLSGPSNGALTLASDGSFDYTPSPGFTGSDGFTYTIRDSSGRTATAAATITVNSTVSQLVLNFQPTGPTFGTFDLLTGAPPAAPPFADLGGDGSPGLTLKKSNGSQATTDPTKVFTWTYVVPASPPLTLSGPVTLQLWSAIGPFGVLASGRIYAYLYDCAAGGTPCIQLASTNVFANPWNTSVLTWSFRTITVGTVTSTLAPTHELQIKILFAGNDLWLTTTAAFPSSVNLTVG